MFSYERFNSVKLERILSGIKKRNVSCNNEGILGVIIKIKKLKKNNKSGPSQIKTFLPYIIGNETITPSQAPLEFMRFKDKIIKIQYVKTRK